ncbi:hypothetical protein Leryth_012548 [Lithospermum erythrorhizon]|nr:hypothetical protein Leryth_012548 [Lithospermum erythrorhizon]
MSSAIFPASVASGGELVDPEVPFKDATNSEKQSLFLSKLNLCCLVYDFSDPDQYSTEKELKHQILLELGDFVASGSVKFSEAAIAALYPRERDCLKSILHRLYGKFMVHSVISGFALPLKEEHKLFLTRALIPLHKPKSLGVYHQQLAYCIVQFVEKDPKLASVVIKGLLKYWPVTNSQKELMFISETEEILEMINMADFEQIMVPLFRQIGCCLNSYHFQVIFSIGFLYWVFSRSINILVQVAQWQMIMPIIFPALERNSRNHWHKTVLNLTQNVRKVFCGMDEELALACQSKVEEDNSKLNVAAEKRRLTWERLETTGSFQTMPSSISSIIEPTTCIVAC